MNPRDLSYQIQQIIAEECQCEAAWVQHKQDCTGPELERIQGQLNFLLEKLKREVRVVA